MKPKKKLVKEIIESLKTEPEQWSFDEYTARNDYWRIHIWTANIPIVHLSIYRPASINFSLIDKIRMYRAINQCKVAKLLKLKNK